MSKKNPFQLFFLSSIITCKQMHNSLNHRLAGKLDEARQKTLDKIKEYLPSNKYIFRTELHCDHRMKEMQLQHFFNTARRSLFTSKIIAQEKYAYASCCINACGSKYEMATAAWRAAPKGRTSSSTVK